MTATERQETILKVSAKCDWPIDRFKITEAGELRLQPEPNDRYQSVDCALRELGLVNAKMGFVGNEAPEEAR